MVPDERSLIGSLLSKIQKYDPDIIFTFDFLQSDISFLISRIDKTKAPFFSKLGRLRITKPPKIGQSKSLAPGKYFAGRILADTLIMTNELVRLSSYDLQSIMDHFCPDSNIIVDSYAQDDVFKSFEYFLYSIKKFLSKREPKITKVEL